MSDTMCDCPDTPLAIAAGAVGFATFLLAFLAWLVTLVVVGRNALEEINTFRRDFEISRTQVVTFLLFCQEETSQNPLFVRYFPNYITVVQASIDALEPLNQDLERLHAYHSAKGFALLRRIKWYFRREKIREKMARLSAQKADIFTLQLNMILRSVS